MMLTQLTRWLKTSDRSWMHSSDWLCLHPGSSACTGPARSHWVTPVGPEGPSCVCSTTRSAENAGWWVGTMLLAHTTAKKRRRERKRKVAFYSGIITLFDLFVPLNKRLAVECECILSMLSLSGKLELWRPFKSLSGFLDSFFYSWCTVYTGSKIRGKVEFFCANL